MIQRWKDREYMSSEYVLVVSICHKLVPYFVSTSFIVYWDSDFDARFKALDVSQSGSPKLLGKNEVIPTRWPSGPTPAVLPAK